MGYQRLLIGLKAWGAKDELQALAEIMGPEAYADHVWRQRYPDTAPRASSGWPFRRAGRGNVTTLKPRQRPS